MKLNMYGKKIVDAITIGLAVIMVSSFVLSYHTLMTMALAHGMPDVLAWLWPLSIDLFMIVSSMTVVRFTMLKEVTTTPWLVVLLTTSASIAFNVASVANTCDSIVLTMAIYAVPPATVFGSLELLLLTIKIEQAHAPVRKTTRKTTKKVVVVNNGSN